MRRKGQTEALAIGTSPNTQISTIEALLWCIDTLCNKHSMMLKHNNTWGNTTRSCTDRSMNLQKSAALIEWYGSLAPEKSTAAFTNTDLANCLSFVPSQSRIPLICNGEQGPQVCNDHFLLAEAVSHRHSGWLWQILPIRGCFLFSNITIHH